MCPTAGVVVIDGQAMRVRSIIKQTETTAADGTRSMLYSFDDQVRAYLCRVLRRCTYVACQCCLGDLVMHSVASSC